MALPDVTTAIEMAVPSHVPARTNREGNAVGNTMLLSIPEEEFTALRPLLEPVSLPRYQVLYEPGEKIDYAYFPNDGMVSLVVIANDGRTVEVGICGRHGVVGVALAFGLNDAFSRAIVQMPGSGLRISSSFLPETFDRCPVLRRMIERYVFTQQLQVAQIAACNRLHDMDQRLARWLLMCQDTIDSGLLPLTHEFIAQMLGSGRPTVTIAAGVLERAGLIQNTRGNVKIVNRKQLEDAACECYGAIQNFQTALALA